MIVYLMFSPPEGAPAPGIAAIAACTAASMNAMQAIMQNRSVPGAAEYRATQSGRVLAAEIKTTTTVASSKQATARLPGEGFRPGCYRRPNAAEKLTVVVHVVSETPINEQAGDPGRRHGTRTSEAALRPAARAH